jgi:kynurenine formamidase
MTGTYIDFPGHIRDTDDGMDAATYPVTRLFRVQSSVIHLDRADGSGAVTAADLRAACPSPVRNGGMVINALGRKRFDEVKFRSVFLSSDAVAWIADQGVHLVVSDIYESAALHGVFGDFFRRGVLTVCSPVNLDALTTARVLLTVLTPAFRGVTQLPCRLLAELIE